MWICKKGKEKKYSESECFFMIKLQGIKKNLIFWFTHG